ncbi:putative metalloprotease CJM1_0395 family protein [Aeromonas rivipollensis]|uniref:putative metalloprotease CJM1_0395 family protein n=1 Tax=Aeromonas rivipollensis TaxID=948519 RepID=UPI0027D9607E|nr:putative metalloprotease CJM1_0395 family protein [uncultured Aeromonas sp.]MDU1144217.1 putative metalloprotease CJM1_0395 family protein [Aeromonas hydrophila]
MNINVSLPPLIPNQLQPQTESAQTDNRRAELVPPSRQSEASNAESGVGSQKERARAAQANPVASAPSTKESGQAAPATVAHRFVEATGEESERRQQQDPEQQEQQRQQRQLAALVERDLEVRKHEQAHQTAGGEHAGSPSYQFSQGPDGKRYATGGEVAIDIGAIPGDPAATLAKMQQVRAAALAPAEPSSQDLSVARAATAKEAQARKELMDVRGASIGPLGAYMDRRNQVIAQHYQQAVRPAPRQTFSQDI